MTGGLKVKEHLIAESCFLVSLRMYYQPEKETTENTIHSFPRLVYFQLLSAAGHSLTHLPEAQTPAPLENCTLCRVICSS